MIAHSVPLVALGAFILIFGFFAFNGGSQASITAPGDGDVVAKAIVNTLGDTQQQSSAQLTAGPCQCPAAWRAPLSSSCTSCCPAASGRCSRLSTDV